MGPHKPLPPIDNKILLMSATELAKKIRKRKLKAEEVMATYIQRIKEVEPQINACPDQRFEDAMKDAVEVDRFFASTGKSEEEIAKETPLLGIPFTCKESVGVKGMAMTYGLVPMKNRKAPSDSDTVALYRKAGAIPVTVTNIPVICMWWESANHNFGMTKNPYDHSRTVGGSSGGEGALITSGGAVIGIGTDLAGSIRIPASFCGIYGHKPSRGVISIQEPWPGDEDDIYNLDQFSSTGPMCRYAQDLRLLTEVLAGDTIAKIDWYKKVDFRNVKVYYMEELPGCLLKATADIKAAVRKAAKHFEDEFGIKTTKLENDDLRYSFDIWECKILEAKSQPFVEMVSEDKPISLRVEFFKSLFGRSELTWPALYCGATERQQKDECYYKCLEKYKVLKRKLEEIFCDDAILLMPTHPEPPPHYLLTIPKYPNIAYTCIFNILGYPSSQIPTGMSGGLPIGIQAVSSLYQDNLTIAAAVELDKVFNGWISPCPITV